jgi:hypothetical protein
MYRHATELLCNDATFEELALAMDLQSTTVENMPLLRMNKFNLLRWFKKNKGIKKIVRRPILANEHKIARLSCVGLIQNLHRQEKKQSATLMRSGSTASQGGKTKIPTKSSVRGRRSGQSKGEKSCEQKPPSKNNVHGCTHQPNPREKFYRCVGAHVVLVLMTVKTDMRACTSMYKKIEEGGILKERKRECSESANKNKGAQFFYCQ